MSEGGEAGFRLVPGAWRVLSKCLLEEEGLAQNVIRNYLKINRKIIHQACGFH